MDQVGAEKALSIVYGIITALGATASITCGIAWGHWKETLDQCVLGRNCSCILYGSHTPSHFLGGYQSPCIWVTYGPLIYILIFIGMCGFHGYRVLFASKRTITRAITAKNEAGETIELHAVQGESTNPLPRVFWMIMSGMTVFFTIYALIHFSIFLDGFLTTCKQYRITLEKLLGVQGTILPVIHGRLTCNAIFDFMDYIQPDSGNAYREGFINTGLDLSIGIAASFFTWILFLFASVLNIRFARIKE